MQASMRSSVMFLLGLLSLASLATAREVSNVRRDAAAWNSCESTLCSRIQDEAEGLARVKLLRSYVVETVRLLDHLMESMDKELVEIAEEMNEFVGPHCRSAHSILANVVERRPRSGNDELSAGIMEESTAQRLTEGPTSSEDLSAGIETGDQRSDENLWSTPDTWQSSTSRDSWTSSTTQTSGSGKDLYGQHSQSTPSYQAQGQQSSSWGVEDNDPWSRESREYDDDVGAGNYYGRRPGSGSSNAYTNKRPQSNVVSGQANVWRPSSGPSSNKSPLGRQRQDGNCRGIPGSPFAVPGIDSWCNVNCGRGYCPPTHCICG